MTVTAIPLSETYEWIQYVVDSVPVSVSSVRPDAPVTMDYIRFELHFHSLYYDFNRDIRNMDGKG